jgi:hypothetical protein
MLWDERINIITNLCLIKEYNTILCTAMSNMILYRGYNNCVALYYMHIVGLPQQRYHGNRYNIIPLSPKSVNSKWSPHHGNGNNKTLSYILSNKA